MAATLKILVPEATVNYILNPSFRYNADSPWTAVGSTISRTLDQALYGIASLKVITNGAALREGVYYRVNSLAAISEPITVSAYVRGRGKVHIRLIEGLGKEWVSPAFTLYSDRWTRMEVSGYSTGSNDLRLYVETDGDPKAITFYVDGAQMERKPYATSFCSGDQPGCRWNIVDSASVSSRDAYTRQGGRWVTLAGPCRDNDDIYITVLGGFGMPPLQHNTQSWALTPGSYFQNTKVLNRAVNILFNVKNVDLRVTTNPDASPLHKLRQQLIDIFKSDVTGGNEAFLFSYQEGEREMLISMRYEAGLEGDWDIRNQWSDSMPVRFLVVDPYFVENNQHAQVLNFKETNLYLGVAGRIGGQWSTLNGGISKLLPGLGITRIVVGSTGKIYASGDFNIINGGAAGTAQNIAWWDGAQWTAFVPGANAIVEDIAVAPNGNIYVTGQFTSIGGVAANYIAYWNGTTWNALGTGLDNVGETVVIAPNGNVYVGGWFHFAGGVAAYHIAYWDGSSWHAMGTHAGLDDMVYSMAFQKDGTVLAIGGVFHDEFSHGGTALLHVALYTVSTNSFSALGSGFNQNVQKVVYSSSNTLYAGGAFTLSGTTSINYLAKWNGSAWIALGSGPPGGVNDFAVYDDEKIITGGAYYLNLWNGSDWYYFDSKFKGPTIGSICVSGDDLYIGDPEQNSALTAKGNVASINYVTNYGTAEAQPIIYIYGPGNIQWIENQTTKKYVALDLYVLDNEEVFIDFGHAKMYSTIRGDLSYAIIPGSDFHDFSLVPGENRLAVFMTNEVDSLMYIYHQPRHWAADATVKANAL
jgi:hypothetical protein